MSEDREPAVLEVSPFDLHCGLELLETGPDRVRASVPVRPQLLQPTGVVHGGVYAAVAEGTASLGTNFAVHSRGEVAMGMANATNFMRPIAEGSIHVTANRLHLGRTSAVWEVRLSDDANRLCAVSRVTLAIRPT